MFWKRTVGIGLLFVVSSLCAFDFQYGSFFQIDGIQTQNQVPVLPLTRGKYANLRVLDKETFLFLSACEKHCKQDVQDVMPKVDEFRPAQTREGMWIAEVNFEDRWLITFLVFKNKTGYAVKAPEHFTFLQNDLKARVEELLSTAAREQENTK